MASRCMDAIVKGIPAAKVGIPFFVFSLFREKTGLIYASKRDRISLSQQTDGEDPHAAAERQFFQHLMLAKTNEN